MIKGLKKFNPAGELPDDFTGQKMVFCSDLIKKISCFVLGPAGTNIAQACEQWIKKTGIGSKTKMVFCETPEESVERARGIKEDGHVAIFWTCAVYINLYKIFFNNPDTLTFFIEEIMYLDEMQLATRPEKLVEIQEGIIPKGWGVASHPSPAPLLDDITCSVEITTSNTRAAEICAKGQVDACITTKSAKMIYNLVLLHKFGSPKMIFYGGITIHGVEILSRAYKEVVKH